MTTAPWSAWSAEEIAEKRCEPEPVEGTPAWTAWHERRRWLATLDDERAAREAAERERDEWRMQHEYETEAHRLTSEHWRGKLTTLGAAARRLLSTSVSDPAWGDRAAELRALVGPTP